MTEENSLTLFSKFILLVVLVGFSFFILNRLAWKKKKPSQQIPVIAVVVLGDVGRSPRMQQHALALHRARLKTVVEDNTLVRNELQQWNPVLVGYKGTQCCQEVEKNIKVIRMGEPLADRLRISLMKFRFLGFILFAAIKILETSIRLAFSLSMIPNLEAVLVQNPPTIPTLPVVWILCRLCGWNFLIDWHNYGTSILSLTAAGRRFSRLSRIIEGFFGRRADYAFCVSKAMRADLIENWGIPSSRLSLLYDKPPVQFRPLSLVERHEILFRYFPESQAFPTNSLSQFAGALLNESILNRFVIQSSEGSFSKTMDPLRTWQSPNYVSISYKGAVVSEQLNSIELTPTTVVSLPSFTVVSQATLTFDSSITPELSQFTSLTPKSLSNRVANLQLVSSRPALLITSTSWTLDEDLDLLLRAMCLYDAKTQISELSLPVVNLLITGLGPGRTAWLHKAEQCKLRNVQIRSIFLPYEDYWRMLASADLGICLHTSSSGLDLPMKVVDMRGVCLPVLAYEFPALPELVKPGETGELFRTDEELANNGFPEQPCSNLRKSCEEAKPNSWDAEWETQALPVIKSLVHP